MNTPLYIARRYLRSKSSNNAINIITRIAAVGVVVGTMALFIVLSGFSGLRDFSLSFSNIFDADLKVYPQSGKIIRTDPAFLNNLMAIEGIDGASQVLEEKVYLNFKGKNHIATIKGVDSNFGKVVVLDSILYVSDWFETESQQAVIGLGTSAKLSLGPYDYSELLEFYVPKPGTNQILDPTQAFSKRSVVVSGVYSVNEELDDQFVFTELSLAQDLLAYEASEVSSLEIKLAPEADEERIVASIQDLFGQPVTIKNRIEQNDALNKMLNTENFMVYLIFTLVLIIALFNVIGSIIMMILDKKKNLFTLQSIGLPLPDIRRVFYYQGFLLTAISGIIGLVLGYIIVFMQQQFGMVKIAGEIPYPVLPTVLNGAIVLITILILGVIASQIASRRVTKNLLRPY